MFFKTDILQRYLSRYAASTKKELDKSCFDSEIRNGYELSYNHYYAFNDECQFVLGLCIIEREHSERTVRMFKIDFNMIEVHVNLSKYVYVPGTSFFEFCQMHGMSPAESQFAYTLSKMIGIRIGSHVL